MVLVRSVAALSPTDHHRVHSFLVGVHQAVGTRLNDHLRVDLEQGPAHGFVAALCETPSGTLVGYAQASVGNDGFVVDCIVAPDAGPDTSIATSAQEWHDHTIATLLDSLLAALPPDRPITWWAHTDAVSSRIAAALHMHPHRQLLLMCRSLPIGQHDAAVVEGLSLRAFRPGVDEGAWLAVNNAAFAAHGEQGGWNLATIQQRERDDWFDPQGFMLHERDGRLAAFCWTKMHRARDWDQHLRCGDDDIVGEIYVIGVHPDFHGLGLGRALTVAGLLHMQRVGASTAMLYVDSANSTAVGLYRSLGFDIADTQQSYLRPASAPLPQEQPA